MTMNNNDHPLADYFNDCKNLSLTARAIIALIVFEKFCYKNKVLNKQTSDFIEHIWNFPLLDDPNKFDVWEKSRPELVNIALGDDPSDEIITSLENANISQNLFMNITSGIVDILWGNFWGAPDDESSREALERVINFSDIDTLPPITPFKFSQFNDNDGWGHKLTIQDKLFWQSLR